MAKLFCIKRSQVLPIRMKEAWDFISSPLNLKMITPPYMDFQIHGGEDAAKMYAGQIIQYTVRPVLNIPLKWVTEITHIHPPFFFVDEQRFGPYKFWHHQHFLEEKKEGVSMCDLVHYSLPMGFLGSLMNTLVVKKQLDEIFDYRHKTLKKMFG